MPFGLTNAPAQFQAHMQTIFGDLLDISVVIYFDDILIFSKTLEEHRYVVREVLKRLHQHGFYAKLSKCEFHKEAVEFLLLRACGLEPGAWDVPGQGGCPEGLADTKDTS